jgi:hypothetical protein
VLCSRKYIGTRCQLNWAHTAGFLVARRPSQASYLPQYSTQPPHYPNREAHFSRACLAPPYAAPPCPRLARWRWAGSVNALWDTCGLLLIVCVSQLRWPVTQLLFRLLAHVGFRPDDQVFSYLRCMFSRIGDTKLIEESNKTLGSGNRVAYVFVLACMLAALECLLANVRVNRTCKHSVGACHSNN